MVVVEMSFDICKRFWSWVYHFLPFSRT